MSNYGLQMEVSSLQSQLNSIRAENARIERELNASIACLVHSTNRLVANENLIGNTIENSRRVLNNSNELALKTHETQIFIEKLYKRYKNVELANKHIRELNDKRNYEFKTFRRIRKLFEGMLDNFNLNYVSLDKINKLIEKDHLLTDKYWLTPCLMGFVGWIQNDKELADKSIKEAIKYDKKSTSLFYMLANLKCNRIDSAVKWLKLYNTCEFVGNDEKDILMLLSIYGDIDKFSRYKELKNEIDILIKRIGSENVDYINENITEIATKCYAKYNKLFVKNDYSFKNLKEHVNEYDDIENSLYYARNNYKILEVLRNFIEKAKSEHLNKYDNNLIELINIPSEAEKETYEQIEFNELIIKLKGDKEKAEEITQKNLEEKGSNINFINVINKHLFNTKDNNVNNKLKGNMFLFSNIFHKIACDNHVRIYNSFLHDKYNISVGEYSTETDFQDISKEFNKIDNYHDNIEKDLISRIKDTGAYIVFACNILVIIAAIYLKDIRVLLLIPVLVLIGIYLIFRNKQKINDIKNTTAKNKAESHIVIKNIFDEYDAYKKMYNEYDLVKEDIGLLFDGIDDRNVFNSPKLKDDKENAYLINLDSFSSEEYEDVEDEIERNKKFFGDEENITFGDNILEDKNEEETDSDERVEISKSKAVQCKATGLPQFVKSVPNNKAVINRPVNNERMSNGTAGNKIGNNIGTGRVNYNAQSDNTIINNKKIDLHKFTIIIIAVIGVVVLLVILFFLKGQSSYKSSEYESIVETIEEIPQPIIIGWSNKNGKSCYYDSNGELYKNKWLNYKNKWYYFDKHGEMVSYKLLTIDNKTYFFNAYGIMVADEWVSYNFNYYYFDKYGCAVKDKWVGDYYLGSDGKMLTNTITPDGYKVDVNGKYIKETTHNIRNQISISEVQITPPSYQEEFIIVVEDSSARTTEKVETTSTEQELSETMDKNAEINAPTASRPVYDPNTPTSADEANNAIVPASSNDSSVNKVYKIGSTNKSSEKIHTNYGSCDIEINLPFLVDQNGENAVDLNGRLIRIKKDIINSVIDIAESEEEDSQRISAIKLDNCKLYIQDEYEVAVKVKGLKYYPYNSSKNMSIEICYSKSDDNIYYNIDTE